MNRDEVNYKTITVNRRARYDYHILERIEAGLVLKGTEIKSAREGRVNIREAYAKAEDGGLWLFNAQIAPYHGGGPFNHDLIRPRKLLLHKDQMAHLIGSAAEKGLTIIALRIYLKNHLAKVELGLVRGKRQYDKRRAIIDRDRDREARQALGRAL